MAEAALTQIHAWRIPRIAAALQARTAALDAALRAAGLERCHPASAATHILGVRPPPDRVTAAADALRRAGVIATVRRGCIRLAPHLHLSVAQLAPVAACLARVDATG